MPTFLQISKDKNTVKMVIISDTVKLYVTSSQNSTELSHPYFNVRFKSSTFKKISDISRSCANCKY